MASISQAQLSADIDHALNDFQVTLTTVLPTTSTGTTFTASKTTLTQGFMVEENGREVEIEAAFHMNIDGVATYPSKGWIVNDGNRDLKVVSVSTGADGQLYKIECIARRQRGR